MKFDVPVRQFWDSGSFQMVHLFPNLIMWFILLERTGWMLYCKVKRQEASAQVLRSWVIFPLSPNSN